MKVKRIISEILLPPSPRSDSFSRPITRPEQRIRWLSVFQKKRKEETKERERWYFRRFS